MGGGSCSYPTYTGEGIVLQYSTNGGINWTNALTVQYYQYRSPSEVTYVLPNDAKKAATRFRWWQASSSGNNYDIWSIDEIYIGANEPYATRLYENFVPDIHSGLWTTYPNGRSGPYCQQSDVFVFDTLLGYQGLRILKTQPLNLVSSSSTNSFIQFWLNVGCGVNQGSTSVYDVQLKYSVGGSSFQYVRTACLYGSCRNQYQRSSSFDWSLFTTWRRVTIPLPLAALTAYTVFAWSQRSFTSTSSWAIDGVYVGDECPNMCSGHGNCTSSGVCSCDAGYAGPSCVSAGSLPTRLTDDFDSGSLSSSVWLRVTGGSLGTLCNTVSSGKSLYFSGTRTRLAETVDMDVTQKALV